LGANPLSKDAKRRIPRECVPTGTYNLILDHHYVIITGVNDDMTTVVAELTQLLEEAEQVSPQQQHQSEMEARENDHSVAMEIEADEPATTIVT